jgi:integral membrane sensor domain MASE1
MTQLKTAFYSHFKPVLVYLTKILILAIIYHLAARLGLKMAYVQANTSPVWPPTGIALAALFILGYRYWPGITLSVLLGSILTGAPVNLAIGMSLGNTLEVLTAVYLLKKVVGLHQEIDRIQDVVGLVFISLACTTIGASIGTLTLMLTGNGEWQNFWPIWTTWWIGDLLGALVITPVLLTWMAFPRIRMNRRAYVEGGILLLLTAAVTWFVFSSLPPVGVFHQALIYVIFPFVIWAALRFGQRGATLAIFIVSGIAIWGTSQGMGPFSLESKNDSLVMLQTFMAVVSLTALILAAATIERRKATDALRQKADDLATLNDSSKTFLDNFEIASLFQTICRLAVTRLGLDIAWIETSDNRDGGDNHIIGYGIPPTMFQSLNGKRLDREVFQETPSPIIKNLGGISISDEHNMSGYYLAIG